MEIITDISKRKKIPRTICLGVFDGVHLGHRKLIETAVSLSKENDTLPAVFTFNIPNAADRIISFERKLNIFEKSGIEEVYIATLDENFKNMLPEDFVKNILIDRLNMSEAVCGFNFTFGRNKSGDSGFLEKLSLKYGFKLTVQDAVKLNGEVISSTVIRELVKSGKIKEANEMLGCLLSFSGTVEKGCQVGRQMEIPTINIGLASDRVKPKNGVYASETLVGGKLYKSITNFGTAPTFGGREYKIETNILGFSGDLYGENVIVYLKAFLREEMKFSSKEELKRTIENDIKKMELI